MKSFVKVLIHFYTIKLVTYVASFRENIHTQDLTLFFLSLLYYLLGKCLSRLLYKVVGYCPSKFCSTYFNIAYNLVSLARLHPSQEKKN